MLAILFLYVIAQIFSPTAILVVPIRIQTKEAKVGIGKDPVTEEVKISNFFNASFRIYKTFSGFHYSSRFGLFLQWNKLLFHLFFKFKFLTYMVFSAIFIF